MVVASTLARLPLGSRTHPIVGSVLSIALVFTVGPRLVAAQEQPPYPPAPPGAGPYWMADTSLRFDIKPKAVARTASVYVDGFLAGLVDEFDGVFQRLHVPPGEHEFVVYLDGYRPVRQRLYLSANASRKIEGTLERLSPGEAPEPPPVPITPPEPPTGYSPPGRAPAPEPPFGRGTPPAGPPRQGQGPPSVPPDPSKRPVPPGTPSQFGTLAIQVQPSGADLLVDGEPWRGPSSADERIIIQVPEGRHHIEIRKDGYEVFQREVTVHRGETAPLNVSLSRRR